MHKLERFLRKTEAALEAASRGEPVEELLAQLQPEQSELVREWEALSARPDYIKGAMKRSKTAQELRNAQVFTLSFAGGGSSQITSWYSLAKRLGISESTLSVYFSRGKNTHVCRKKYYNPAIDEDDILTVTRLVRETDEQPIRKRGRPPKFVVDWGQLGTEAPSNPDGTQLAESARTMPKTRNRRTDENP